jgi:hypothetical protein
VGNSGRMMIEGLSSLGEDKEAVGMRIRCYVSSATGMVPLLMTLGVNQL